VVMTAVGATFQVAEKTLASVEHEYKQVNEEYTAAARQIEQVKQMLQKRKTVADRVELAVSLREKLPRSNVLAEVANGLPPGVSLTDASLEAKRLTAATAAKTSFEQKSAAGQPAAEAPPEPLAFETKLILTGISYTEGQVSDYIDALNRSGYFKAVDLRWVRKGTNTKDDEAMRTFALLIELDPDAEAMPLKDRRALRPTVHSGESVANDAAPVPVE
jgi:Tfp pilus assembly protein PilN